MATVTTPTTLRIKARHWWQRREAVPDPTTLLLHQAAADATRRAVMLSEISNVQQHAGFLKTIVEYLDKPNE